MFEKKLFVYLAITFSKTATLATSCGKYLATLVPAFILFMML